MKTKAILGAIFLIGFGLGYIVAPAIELPLTNPLGATGNLSVIGYNPANNLLRFAMILLAPAILLISVKRIFSPPRPVASSITRGAKQFALVTATIFATLVALNTPTFHAWGKFDPFHEGEALAAAVAFEHEGVPFRDFSTFHGWYQDVTRGVLAHKLFGETIGGSRALESAGKVLTYVSLALLVAELWSYEVAATLAVLLLLFSINGFGGYLPPLGITPRDLIPILFALSVARIHRGAGEEKGVPVSFFAYGFLPFIALLHSIDRGVYLAITAIVILPIVLPLAQKYRSSAALILGGVGAGVFALVGALGSAATDLLDFALFTLPRYKDLLDGYIYPLGDPRYVAALGLPAINLFLLAGSALRTSGFRLCLRENLPAIALVVIGILNFRNLLNRPDKIHLEYSTLFSYLGLLFLLTPQFVGAFQRSSVRRFITGVSLFVALLAGGRIYAKDLLAENFPVTRTDESFLPPGDRPAIEWLRAHLGPNDTFFAFAAEPSWYFFLSRPSPARFAVSWHGATREFESETIERLERKKLRYVLWKTNSSSDRLDGLSMEERLPRLARYLRENFQAVQALEGREIWEPIEGK